MTSLYTLSTELAATLGQLDEETGELPEGFVQIQQLVEDKLLATAAFALETDARAAQLTARASELAEQAKRLRKRTAWLDRYMAEAMRRSGIAELRGADFSVRLERDRDAAVEVTDEAALPAEYWRVKETRAPDKTALREALKAGAAIPGAALVLRDRFTRR